MPNVPGEIGGQMIEESTIICLNIVGEPVPWSPFIKRYFTSKHRQRYDKLKAWQNSIAWQAKSQLPDDFKTWNDELYLRHIKFRLTKPKSVTSKRPKTKPDFDNLLKAVLDALQGIVYTNDSRFTSGGGWEKIWATQDNPPGVSLQIERII